MPNPYQIINGAAVLPDGKMKATDEQIEAKEMHIMEYEKCEYLAQHVMLSTTSPWIGVKNRNCRVETTLGVVSRITSARELRRGFGIGLGFSLCAAPS